MRPRCPARTCTNACSRTTASGASPNCGRRPGAPCSASALPRRRAAPSPPSCRSRPSPTPSGTSATTSSTATATTCRSPATTGSSPPAPTCCAASRPASPSPAAPGRWRPSPPAPAPATSTSSSPTCRPPRPFSPRRRRTVAAGEDLAGRRALVTGASRGIGAAVAEALAAAGADVVLHGRAAAQLAEHAETITKTHGVRTAVLTADLGSPAAVESLAADALAAFGGLDILVNNAGITYPETVFDLSLEAWEATLAVNLTAPALLAARIGAAMAEAGGGSIVNVSSLAGLRALTEHYAYCASKAAVQMATKVLALELGPHGVRANAVCPTVVLTEMGQQVWGEAEKAGPMLARIPIGRFGVPADVAAAVVWLCSDAAGMVNGVELALDGGLSVA